MPQQNLKILIENGGYRPEPEQVALAMLRRRSVRALLTSALDAPISPVGRIQRTAAPPRQAA